MESRREFLKKTGRGALYTSALATAPSLLANSRQTGKKQEGKPFHIGIIGAENSHTIGFGEMFNIEKKFPGMELNYVWGETEEFARRAMEKGNIPNMVKDPLEMLGKIDALIVDHRHARYHLEAARPFVLEGIPTFIDKPFCYRVSEGEEFLSMARKVGTPVTSYSSIRQTDGMFDIKEQLPSLGEFNQIVSYGPADMDSQYGGIFFYGVHIVEPMLLLFGARVLKVRITRQNANATASLVFGDGKLATLIFKNLSYGWETFIESESGVIQLRPGVEESDPVRGYREMVEMFKTGREPRSHQSILAGIAVLEALEKSVATGDWVEVYQVA